MDNSLETWLHELEMEIDPTFSPEFYTEKMASSSGVEITTKQEETELEEKLYQYSFSGLHPYYDQDQPSKPESSIPFSVTTTKSLPKSRDMTTSEAGISSSTANILSLRNLGSLQVDFNGNLDHNKKPRNSPTMASLNWIEFDAAVTGHEGDNWTNTVSTTLPLPHHIVIERKRREDLNQRFLALSKVVPGVKKRDKASILGEAVKYMKDLQEHIKNLEEKKKKKVVESVVFVQRSTDHDHQLLNANNYSYTTYSDSDDNFSSNNHSRLLPEIEVKVLERSVLIRVHCEKNKGILPRLLTEIAKLHLIVVTSNVIPFGNDTDITVIAQMEADFCMETKDIVECLRLALPNFI